MRLPSILNLRGSTQSALLKRNILASFMLKGVSILISFFIVPLTIDFVNPTQYGIWLTLSSLLAWFSFFDIGLSLGFRNRFAQAKAKANSDSHANTCPRHTPHSSFWPWPCLPSRSP